MWFKLANVTFEDGKHLGSMSTLSTLISINYTATGFDVDSNSRSVSKTANSATLTLTLNSKYTCTSTPTVTIASGGAAVLNGTPTWSGGVLTIKIKPSNSKATFGEGGTSISITVNGAVINTPSEPDTPVTPTNYTFTINPTPTSATVVLSASGYSTVSGTGSKSITVANGTKVNWSVSASGYTTRTGNWTISGGNKTESIALTATGGSSGGGEEDGTEIDITDRITARFTPGAIYHVMNTDSGGGAHGAQTAYQGNSENGAFVDISEYAGKKLKITVPNALVESHNKYGTVFYTGTSKSTAVKDYGYAMVYDANNFQVPTATIVEIDIPADAKNIKTTWHTAENETICGVTFSAKVIV